MIFESFSTIFFSMVGAYLIGSIPTGYVIAQWFGIPDIRQHGSGNIGATNVARILGYRFFFLIFFLDAGKAYGYTALLRHYFVSDTLVFLCAAMLLVGNRWSLFLNFRGGKGVATAFGILLAIQPLLLAGIALLWLCSFVITRTVGIASAFSIITAPVWCVVLGLCTTEFFIFILFMATWIVVSHRDNIRRYF